jgi:hypothetical protein
MAPEMSPLVRLQNTRIVLDADERRSLYRVGRNTLETVRVVAVRHKKRIPVLLLDASATGCAVCVTTEMLPQLRTVADGSGPDGWTVGIWKPQLERPLAVPASARYLKPMPGGVRIGFEFALKASHRGDLDARLLKLFNQRRAVRARPPTHESIRVDVTRGEDEVQVSGLLRELSLMGTGVLVGTEDGAKLAVGDTVKVKLNLIGGDAPELTGTLRYQKDLGLPAAAAEYGAPATHLGIEFSPGVVRAARATNTIGGFVVEQQMRMKREA